MYSENKQKVIINKITKIDHKGKQIKIKTIN